MPIIDGHWVHPQKVAAYQAAKAARENPAPTEEPLAEPAVQSVAISGGDEALTGDPEPATEETTASEPATEETEAERLGREAMEEAARIAREKAERRAAAREAAKEARSK